MGKLFGRNFVFRPVFLSVLPAEAGRFVLFSLLQKCGLGKVLSVNDLLRLFELKFLRVMRVNGGGDRAAQTMPRPDADDLAGNAAFLATADEGMPQLVRVAFGHQPFHARGDGVEVCVFCPFEVDIGQHLFHHRREGDFPKHDILSQSLFARLALQPLIVNDLDAFELRLAQAEVEQNEQSVRAFHIFMRFAVVDKPRLFVLRERLSALRLIGGQHDFLHGGGKVEILCRHVEDAVEHERQLFRLAVLVFTHDSEEIGLKIVPCDVCERFVAESRFQVHAEGTFILLKGGRLCRLFLDLQPLSAVVPEEDGICGGSG